MNRARLRRVIKDLQNEAEEAELKSRGFIGNDRSVLLAQGLFFRDAATRLDNYLASQPKRDILGESPEPPTASVDTAVPPSKVPPTGGLKDHPKPHEMQEVGYIAMSALIKGTAYESVRIQLVQRLHCTMGRATDLVEYWEATTKNKLLR